MAERTVDLRSDTVTRPSPGMRRAMAEARVGDDVLGDDPVVKVLEERMASLLGKEAAVFTPSGTMANLLSLLSQTKPGDEVILDRNCHIFNYEAGGASAVGGLQLHPLDGKDGFLPLERLSAALRPDNIHHPDSALITAENTHNRGAGRIYPFDQLQQVSSFARENGLRFHIDGARLANAVVATGISWGAYGALADSFNICFSKGLGAPIGSILVSDQSTITRARSWRKRLGGGMRQVGILAAAALYALDHNLERLAEDHRRASRIAAIVESNPDLTLAFPVETNIVIFRVREGARDFDRFYQNLLAEGILALAIGDRKIRLVTHLDIPDEDIDYFEEVMTRIR
ncbi:MAG: low-specificity L-threonine aldolase [Candidatus Krumholzibacteriota bacterium]|nr:low-specificity L-threonine aldolase [Candidatus Krumholzibacteriota bacterium]